LHNHIKAETISYLCAIIADTGMQNANFRAENESSRLKKRFKRESFLLSAWEGWADFCELLAVHHTFLPL
jgi:hypothetical protein